jgi:hypothetical protein
MDSVSSRTVAATEKISLRPKCFSGLPKTQTHAVQPRCMTRSSLGDTLSPNAFAVHGAKCFDTVTYRFDETRVAEVALLIFTVLSGWRSCGVVITKFSDHAVTFRSSPTVFAETPVPASASTRILGGKPLSAISSAAMFLHLYRGMECPC